MSRVTERVYLSPPHLDGDELDRVIGAIESNWVAPLGPDVDGFETDFLAWCGREAAAAVSSGTAALHLSLLIAGIEPGDRVIVPTMTFAATANAVTYAGAEPVFVDVDPGTANVDVARIDTLMEEWPDTRRPKALVAVDLYGQCCDYDALVPACERWGLLLIEDAAEALGATFDGRLAGSFGEMSAFSFNGNKIITCSGGGMLCGEAADAERARFLATQAREPVPYYEHETIGFNYRMSNVLAALGRGQLARLGDKIERRRAIRQRYAAAFASLDGVEMLRWDDRGEPNGWLSVVLFGEAAGVVPDDVRLALEADNIEARPMWKPMHRQPVFRDRYFGGGNNADRLFATGLCLPSGSSLTDADQQRVIDILGSVVADRAD